MVAPDPFRTEKPITAQGMATFRTIAARLAALHPPIFIEGHIAQSERAGKKAFSSLMTSESTLDGISFVADRPRDLAAAIEKAGDRWGQPAMISMEEDPDHWALMLSLGATVGTGWREVWREAPYMPPGTAPREKGSGDNLMKMRFGTAGHPIRFTALHAAVHEIGGQCNIHIDETGFMLALPKGVSMTPDFYGHLVHELLFKTTFRDWLVGLTDNETAKRVLREAVRRVSFHFINSANGYAGLEKQVNGVRGPRDAIFTAAKILMPMGVSIDVIDRNAFKVQVTGTARDGDLSVSVTLGGEW